LRKSQLVQGTRTEAFHQNIGVLDQPLEDRPVRIRLEIKMNDGLSGIDQLIGWSQTIGVDRTQSPHRITGGRLDLDHIGAEIGQDLTGVGTGEVLAEIEYPDTFQQQLRHD